MGASAARGIGVAGAAPHGGVCSATNSVEIPRETPSRLARAGRGRSRFILNSPQDFLPPFRYNHGSYSILVIAQEVIDNV